MESDINVESSTTTNNSQRTTSSPFSVNEESRRIMPTMVSLLFLITLLVPKFIGGNAEEYSSICSLEQNPIILLQKDKWGNFMVVNTTMVNEMDSGLNSTNWSNRIDTGPSTDLFRAKECGCSDRDKIQYCLEKKGDTCGIPRDQKRPIGCFHLDSRTIFIKNAWPVVLLWYGALVLFLIATENGRNARNYLISLCSNSRNLAIADQIVSREIQLRDQMRLAAMAQQRRVMELARMRREEENPTLILKTKRYCSPKKKAFEHIENSDFASTPVNTEQVSHSNEDSVGETPNAELDRQLQSENNTSYVYNEHEEEVTCTICFVPIADGDRVGALPCNHLFHSSCLKQWIKRRNVCPLCQEPDIATPQRSSTSTAVNIPSSRLSYQETQELNDGQDVGQLDIVANTLSDWTPRRQSLTLNADSDIVVGSPIPPPPPRGRVRRMQRLTLSEEGDVHMISHPRVRSRRDIRMSRGRGLRSVMNQRSWHRHNNRDRNRFFFDRDGSDGRRSLDPYEPTWLHRRGNLGEDV